MPSKAVVAASIFFDARYFQEQIVSYHACLLSSTRFRTEWSDYSICRPTCQELFCEHFVNFLILFWGTKYQEILKLA
jgi:hypothetical protein